MILQRFVLSLSALLVLASCGVDEPPAELSPTGYWSGYMVPQDGTPIVVDLMMLADGTAFINRDDGALVGNVNLLGEQFVLATKGYATVGETWDGGEVYVEGEFSGRVYPPGTLGADFELAGEAALTPGSGLDDLSQFRSLIGEYEHGQEHGRFELVNLPFVYETVVDMDDVKGSWALPGGETGDVAATPVSTSLLSVNSAGEFDGYTPDGCQFVGRISQEATETGRNAFNIRNVAAYCPRYEDLALNGQFNGGKGIAYLAGSQNQYLVMMWVFEWNGGGYRVTWLRQ